MSESAFIVSVVRVVFNQRLLAQVAPELVFLVAAVHSCPALSCFHCFFSLLGFWHGSYGRVSSEEVVELASGSFVSSSGLPCF